MLLAFRKLSLNNEIDAFQSVGLGLPRLIRPAFDYPNTNRQLRLAIHNRHKSALLYSASDVELLLL